MNELEITIIEMLEKGHACVDIAQELDIPLVWVENVLNAWAEELELA